MPNNSMQIYPNGLSDGGDHWNSLCREFENGPILSNYGLLPHQVLRIPFDLKRIYSGNSSRTLDCLSVSQKKSPEKIIKTRFSLALGLFNNRRKLQRSTFCILNPMKIGEGSICKNCYPNQRKECQQSVGGYSDVLLREAGYFVNFYQKLCRFGDQNTHPNDYGMGDLLRRCTDPQNLLWLFRDNPDLSIRLTYDPFVLLVKRLSFDFFGGNNISRNTYSPII